MTRLTVKIREELMDRLDNGNGSCVLHMKKSKDIVTIEAEDKNLDEDTRFLIKTETKRPIPHRVRVKGITNLALSIETYDKVIDNRTGDERLEELFKLNNAIQSGKATAEDKEKYAQDFEKLFGFRPTESKCA